MSASELLRQYVFLHNYGVENGDFEPMMQLFDDDIVLAFEDERIGVFEGIESVRRVFRLQSPSTAICIGDIIESEGKANSDYADEASPSIRLGRISVDIVNDKIAKIFIGK